MSPDGITGESHTWAARLEMTDNAPIDDDRHPDVPADRAMDAALVEQARSGDPQAFGQLYDRWLDRTYALVRGIVRDVDTTEEICQEAFLTAWQDLQRLQDPLAFGGWLLRIARNKAITRATREQRTRPVDGERLVMIEETGSDAGVSAPSGFGIESSVARAEDPAAAVAIAEVAALVKEAAATLGERDGEVLELQLRSQLTPAEIGEVIGLNRNAANQLCHRVRLRFATAFGARLLWHGARPSCPDLGAELAAAGITDFGAAAVPIADNHSRDCSTCNERRRTLVQPAAFFGSIPLVGAPLLVRQRVAERLAARGVPMGEAGATSPPSRSGQDAADSSLPDRSADSGPTIPEPGPTSIVGPPATPGSTARRVALAAAAVVAVATIAVVTHLATRDRDQHDTVAAAEPTTTSTTIATERAAPTTSAPLTDPVPGQSDNAATDEPPGTTVRTTNPTANTKPAPTTTTTTAPHATVDTLELAPATTQATPYPMGSTSPLLRWSIRNAGQVKVWLLTDSGGGLIRTKVLSAEASGELRVCPGTVVDNRCHTPRATYAFEVEAMGLDGVVVLTTSTDRPSYDVVEVIG